MVLLLATFARAEEPERRPVDIAPVVGLVVNDPFTDQAFFGAALTVHANEVLGVEVLGLFGPEFDRNDYIPSRVFIADSDAVTLDISRVEQALGASLRFTPLHGTIGERRPVGLEVSALLGTGLVRTRDNLEALDKTDDPEALATEDQIHPMLQVGASTTARFSPAVAWTLDARMFSFIEVIEADTLEMKRPILVSTGVAWSPRRR